MGKDGWNGWQGHSIKLIAFRAICQNLSKQHVRLGCFLPMNATPAKAEEVDSITKTISEWFVLMSSSVR